ncbi:MAG: NADH:ubiquinone reductase (Na(+)-transporting) subunit F [Bacteroidetes bacterium]|nr:MAG: NADH:ubiquinone reductase (Na(+)-transporting) subunit F [Bacteroidota bacterium]
MAANTTMIITLSVVIFLAVILLLVIMLLVAQKKLVPQGKVEVSINDGEKLLDVNMGGSLLSTLTSEGVLLPSACGGGGTCGTCRCQVPAGGGGILPTETGFFTRKEQENNWRLACQVKVRDNIQVEVPEAVLGVKKWECEVVSNRNVATFIKEFVVRLPEGEHLNFKSGGYIQIDVPEIDVDFSTDIDVDEQFRDEWDRFNLWSLKMHNPEASYRAYSMANHPAESNIIMLNVRIATPPFDRVNGGFQKLNPGICSSYIFSRKPGDKVNIAGPYGEFFLVENSQREMMFIGGGAGMAPMRSHLFHLFRTLKSDRKVTFWYGARSRREIFYEEDFRSIARDFPNFTFTIALSDPHPDDNWDGATGFIHQVILDQYLNEHEAPEDIEYYLCGPPPMTAAINRMLYDLGVEEDMIHYDNFGG